MTKIKKNSKVDIRYAKSEKYRQVLGDIIESGVCPFCPEHFKWHTNPILYKSGQWVVTKSFQPYKNAQHHFIMIGKEHKETLLEITLKDLGSILKLSQWVTKEFNIPGGGLTMRFGDTLYTGATVKHIHVHYIVPQVKNKKVTPVYFPIG